LTKSSAVWATSRQPWSIVREWPLLMDRGRLRDLTFRDVRESQDRLWTNGPPLMLSVIRRHAILRPAVVWLVIAVLLFAVVWFALMVEHVPVGQPYVEVVTTRCVRPDGEAVGSGYGQPCPSGLTPETVVIQSHLPMAQP
jgi:hypothetical protein